MPEPLTGLRGVSGCPASSGVRALALPPRSPNLNAFSERWGCSIRQECLSKLILFGKASLRRALNEYIDHHHFERNHQGKGNVLLFPYFSSSLIQTYRSVPRAGPFAVATDSAACLSSTPESLDSLTTWGQPHTRERGRSASGGVVGMRGSGDHDLPAVPVCRADRANPGRDRDEYGEFACRCSFCCVSACRSCGME